MYKIWGEIDFSEGNSGLRTDMDAMQTGITLSSYETPHSAPVVHYV
jgi:hypothetical protein